MPNPHRLFHRPWFLSLSVVMAAAMAAATVAATPQSATPATAPAWLDAAIAAMGGRARLAALRSISATGFGSSHALEQSERPEGPWIAAASEFTELFDVQRGRLSLTATDRNTQAPDPMPMTTLVAGDTAVRTLGDRAVPLPEAFSRPLIERIELGPERLLLTAAEAPASALTLDGPVDFQGVPHVRLGFPWRGGRAVILLNTLTGLPSAVEIVRAYPDDVMLGVWGDMTRRIEYAYWTLESGRLRYPRQWNVYENDQQREMRTITSLELDVAVDEEIFAPLAAAGTGAANASPSGAGSGAAPAAGTGGAAAAPARPTRRTLAPRDMEEPEELAPGILQLRSWWNVVLVDQGDAVVVIEGPLSSEYSEKILALVAERFDKPVRAVISSSDAWPHIGGLRTYVAEGVPVLTHPLNRPLLERLFAAPYLTVPDRLAQQPRAAEMRGVARRVELGSGPNRLIVAPIEGEWSERMVMVYFPEHGLLYGSDLVFPPNPRSDAFFMPVYLDELVRAAEREGFTPRQVIAMHAAPVAWDTILAEIERVSR